MGLLRTLFIIWLVYIVFRFLVRLLFPSVLRYTMNKAQEQAQRQQQEQQKKEGEVRIEHIPDKKNKDDDRGEYIDYEEVK